jgi:hypothetical protein
LWDHESAKAKTLRVRSSAQTTAAATSVARR